MIPDRMQPVVNKPSFLVHRAMGAVEASLRRAGLEGSRLLVAVSGGGDSMALLELTALVAPKLALALEVACIDHAMRSEAKDEIELVRFAASRCEAGFHTLRIDSGAGDEETLRDARFAALREIAARSGCRAILLGHNADDQIETMLFRFLRGAGFGGLAGMREWRDPFLRPMLGLRRETLRALLRERGVAWLEDPSNDSDRYARGRLRRGVIPAVEAAVGAGALEHLLDLAPRWRADEDFLEAEAARLFAYAERRGPSGSEIDLRALASGHEALRARVLRRWLREGLGSEPGSRLLAAVERWLQGSGGKTRALEVPGAQLSRRGDRLALLSKGVPRNAGRETAAT